VALELKLLDPEVLADPYPLLHRLRREAPVHWDEAQRVWTLARYGDALFALREDGIFSSAIHAGGGVLDTSSWFVFHDPPRHTFLRNLAAAAFTPAVIERLRPRVQAIVDAQLDRLAEGGSGDLIAELAFPLPALVIGELLGVPSADLERIKAWSTDLAALGSTVRLAADRADRVRRAQQSASALNEYFRDIVRHRLQARGDDLVSGLVCARADGRGLNEDELVQTCTFLLFTGHETTTNLIGNGMLALLRHPDALAALHGDPGLLRSAVEELARFDSPVQVRVRLVQTDVEIGGQTLRKGDRVWILLGAANRDPDRFVDPDRLLLDRADNRHLAFGYGIHFCLGAALARLEGTLAIGALTRRFRNLQLATEVPVWRANPTMRGLHALPVTVR
jgi:cytochrome P450